MSMNFEDLFGPGFGGFGQTDPILKKWPNFYKYPSLIQDCLRLNERIQAIGA